MDLNNCEHQINPYKVLGLSKNAYDKQIRENPYAYDYTYTYSHT